jgi:hypothetical protein
VGRDGQIDKGPCGSWRWGGRCSRRGSGGSFATKPPTTRLGGPMGSGPHCTSPLTCIPSWRPSSTGTAFPLYRLDFVPPTYGDRAPSNLNPQLYPQLYPELEALIDGTPALLLYRLDIVPLTHGEWAPLYLTPHLYSKLEAFIDRYRLVPAD